MFLSKLAMYFIILSRFNLKYLVHCPVTVSQLNELSIMGGFKKTSQNPGGLEGLSGLTGSVNRELC